MSHQFVLISFNLIENRFHHTREIGCFTSGSDLLILLTQSLFHATINRGTNQDIKHAMQQAIFPQYGKHSHVIFHAPSLNKLSVRMYICMYVRVKWYTRGYGRPISLNYSLSLFYVYSSARLYIYMSVQERRNSCALAMELRLSCINP